MAPSSLGGDQPLDGWFTLRPTPRIDDQRPGPAVLATWDADLHLFTYDWVNRFVDRGSRPIAK